MKVIDRFLQYTKFDTTSDENSESVPSNPDEKILGAFLVEEMKSLGIGDAYMDKYGYVYGHVEASEGQENQPVIGLIAHMDTSPSAKGSPKKTKVIDYQGGDIVLESGLVTKEDVFTDLKDLKGERLLVTDGQTLLGSDDQAGIAEILTLVEELNAHPEWKHGKIAIAFTVDEEIGRGADYFDLKAFGADFAYTVDGGTLNEIEDENFNAAGACVLVHGVSVHTGSAKNKLRNAVLMATDFISALPENERPETTEGREGFYHVDEFTGDVTKAKILMLIRDHDRNLFEKRKEFLRTLTKKMNEKYGNGTFELLMKDSYFNMKEELDKHPEVMARAKKAYEAVGITPVTLPIRGGTDGARLTFQGLPCPNLSTGGRYFHGPHELLVLSEMEKVVDILKEIVKA